MSQNKNLLFLMVFLFFTPQISDASKLLEKIRSDKQRSDYGWLVKKPECDYVDEVKHGSLLLKLLEENQNSCKKVTFTCQEEIWHIPEVWRVIIDEKNRSTDLASGTYTKGRYTLQTGFLGSSRYHELDKLGHWIMIPIKKTEDMDKKLVIHEKKLSGSVVVNKRVFDKENGYQNKEYKYYCRQSVEDYKP